MVPVTAWAVLAGLGLGLGLCALLASMPRLSRPSLSERLAPYLLDVSALARADVERAGVRGLAILRALLGPAAVSVHGAVLRWLGSEESVASRLRQAGSARTVAGFRGLQLGAIAAGTLAGGLLAGAVAPVRTGPPVVAVALVVTFALGGFAVCDHGLSRAARRRLKRVAEEFPTVAELLALSLSAGEGSFEALRRVARASSGQLGAELRAVVTDVNLGVPLVDALERMSRALCLPRVTLFVDAVVGAIERGAPLADVLRAQAGDARAERKRELLEAAGRKEVVMLVPLIFGLLPLTVVIAVFPGVFILRTGL